MHSSSHKYIFTMKSSNKYTQPMNKLYITDLTLLYGLRWPSFIHWLLANRWEIIENDTVYQFAAVSEKKTYTIAYSVHSRLLKYEVWSNAEFLKSLTWKPFDNIAANTNRIINMSKKRWKRRNKFRLNQVQKAFIVQFFFQS